MIMVVDTLVTVGLVLLVFFFLGLCIFVHELGHLLVALWRGLHVERFSIGFGRRLWGVNIRGVEYVVSMLPFGGYVALPQLDPTETPQDRDGNPLPRAKPLDRILTAFSGPLANVGFGFLLASVLWLVGVERPAPVDRYVVHTVAEESPEYQAGLRPGDAIVAVNGQDVARFREGWQKVAEIIALSAGEVTLTLDGETGREDISYQPARNPEFEGIGYPFFDVRMPVVVEGVRPDYPAAAAGLQAGDLLLAVNGKEVANWFDFTESVRSAEGETISLTYQRAGQVHTLPSLPTQLEQINDKMVRIIGVMVGEPKIMAHISPWAQFVNVLSTTKKTVVSLFNHNSYVKPRHMSGPVGIVQMNYMMLRYKGLRQGLSFVVFVSFSLALVNLLPVPVLDGGHILFALIEGVVRRPVPTRLAYALQAVFAVLLIGFMLYVTFFDVRRVGRSFFPAKAPDAAAATAEPEADN